MANSYYRFRDPAKLVAARFIPIMLHASYFPSYGALYYTLTPNMPREKIGKLSIRMTGDKDKILVEKEVAFSEQEGKLQLPALPDGTYRLRLSMTDATGKSVACDNVPFTRTHYAWENNTLGITEQVYPPYQPVTVQGPER